MTATITNELTGQAVLGDSEGRQYHVCFDLDAVMQVEKLTGRTALDILMGAPGVIDCVAMILAGTAGYGRRNAGAPRLNANLAQRVFVACGGLPVLAPVLAESMSCAEGLGLSSVAAPDDDEGEAGPLASRPS